MYMPKVSIITVCYNSVKTLEDTIKSVVNQTYSNIEYIVIDGGSTDGTVDIIKKYNDKITYWVSEADSGIYNAMNKGINVSTGDIIGIINSDDWYDKFAVGNAVYNFSLNDTLDVVCGNVVLNDENGVAIAHAYSSEKLGDLWKTMSLQHPTCFLRKRVYDTFGLYDENYKIAADHELMLRLYLKGRTFIYCQHVVANMRLGGVSSTIPCKGFQEVRDTVIKYGMSTFKAYIFYYKKYLRVRLSIRNLGFKKIILKRQQFMQKKFRSHAIINLMSEK